MSVTFLSPYAALIGLGIVLPLGALLLRERSARRVRDVLGTATPRRRAHAAPVAALVVSFGLLAAAAAQPVVRTERTVQTRVDAQAFVVFDISRSMLAAPGPDEEQRIDRAIARSQEIRDALPDLPVGVATLTNRLLPHLFPTNDRGVFSDVVASTIGVNRPPGTEAGLFRTSTDFSALKSFATDNYFAPSTLERLVILLTDGESSAFAPRLLVRDLEKGGVDVVVVRFWDDDERVWGAGGRAEPLYRPTPLALAPVEELAQLTGAGRVFDETEPAAAAAAVRAAVGTGETVPVVLPGRTESIAPWAVLAACVPFALLLLGGIRPVETGRPRRVAYSMLAAWRASSRTAASRSPRAPASPRRS